MFNKSILTLGAILLSCNLWAGNVQMIEEALELSIDQVILPGSSAGSISVRKCGSCESERLPMNARTEFRIGEESASFAAFRAASRNSKAIYVFYDMKTGVVTRMVLDMPRRKPR